MPTELPPGFDEYGHPEVSSIIPEDLNGVGMGRENSPRSVTREEQDALYDELDKLFEANGTK